MDAETTEYLSRQIDEEFRRFLEKEAPPNGFEPLPDIPAGRYIDDGFFDLEDQPKKAAVVGAGYIAVEMAGRDQTGHIYLYVYVCT